MCCDEQLELEMIDKLDTHITQGRGDAGFKEDLSRMWVTAHGTQGWVRCGKVVMCSTGRLARDRSKWQWQSLSVCCAV